MAVIEAIATAYLEADYESVTFSGIPGTYEHLQLRASVRTDDTDYDMIKINFNGDTNANYSRHYLRGWDVGEQGGAYTPVDSSYGGWLPGANLYRAYYGSVVVDIFDYADDGNKNTTLSWLVGHPITGSPNLYFVSGVWNSTAAVTSVVATPHQGSNFRRGSEFSLYGLNSAN